MFRPQPLHQLPSLGIGGNASAAPFLPGCGPLLDAGSALPKGGQVMFRPQPLHQLPSLGIGGDASAVPFLPGCGAITSAP